MSAGTGGEAGREGLFVSLKNLVATLLAIGKTRAELLVNELEEEKFRLMSLWAKAIGARVVVTAGSDAKRERCRQLGAEAAIDYRGEDWPAQVRAATQGHGADVILDIVGARYLDGNVACLAVGGRIVVIGLQGGTRGELDLAALLMRRGTLMATSLRARPAEQKAAICAGLVADVWPLLGSGRILPVIDQVLPLEQVRRAHEQLAAGSVTGKLVLQVGPSSDR